jgi:hypothetical protein
MESATTRESKLDGRQQRYRDKEGSRANQVGAEFRNGHSWKARGEAAETAAHVTTGRLKMAVASVPN